MTITVTSAGPILSIQDKGRFGLRAQGVSAAGPVDPVSFRLANLLCENSDDMAALEFAGPGGSFITDQPIRFAVVAPGADISVNGERRAEGESHRLIPGDNLIVGMPKGCVWGYLAFSGGIQTRPVLRSRATHLRFGLGGLEGRVLRAGDQLPIGPSDPHGPCLRSTMQKRDKPNHNIRIILGPQDDYFTPDVINRLITVPFFVTQQRDRMAMVLDGPALPAIKGHDIVSDGTVPGCIQVPGSGQPIVLMCESQTSGGYPKIATVLSCDLPRLAQMVNGTEVHFEPISIEDAHAAYAHHKQLSDALKKFISLKSAGALTSEFLLAQNLIGGITDPEEVVWTQNSVTD